MRVAVRADASLAIGTGHVVRCLALAERLRAAGASVAFVCRELPGDLRGAVEERGFALRTLPAPAAQAARPGSHLTWLGVPAARDARETAAALDGAVDWLVVDHYGLGAAWEGALRPQARAILAIDDLADRRHDCDALLDANPQCRIDAYRPLVPSGCRLLLGPRYALLRAEFARRRAAALPRRAPPRRVLLFFGGVDLGNESERALRVLAGSALRGARVDVVVGASNPHRARLARVLDRFPDATLHVQTERMADLVASADLALCSAGSFLWEALCLALPCVVIATADNQVADAEELAARGCIDYLGRAETLADDDLARALDRNRDPGRTRAMAERGAALVDGNGAERVGTVLRRRSAGAAAERP